MYIRLSAETLLSRVVNVVVLCAVSLSLLQNKRNATNAISPSMRQSVWRPADGSTTNSASNAASAKWLSGTYLSYRLQPCLDEDFSCTVQFCFVPSYIVLFPILS